MRGARELPRVELFVGLLGEGAHVTRGLGPEVRPKGIGFRGGALHHATGEVGVTALLERLLRARQLRGWSFDLEEGVLDAARLSRVIVDHARAGRVLLLSSHQLDLVENLCETITLVHHGRVVLQGDVRELKAASPERSLRVDVAVEDVWVAALGASVTTVDASGSRVRLAPGTDAAAVLDAVRADAECKP